MGVATGGGYRLDHLIVSAGIEVEDCRYGHAWRRDLGLSDHSPLRGRVRDRAARPRVTLKLTLTLSRHDRRNRHERDVERESADERTRTSTGLPPRRPERRASANSATSACGREGSAWRGQRTELAAAPQRRAEHVVPERRAHTEPARVVLEVVAHVQFAQQLARAPLRACGGARGSGSCRRPGSRAGSRRRTRPPPGSEHEHEQRVETGASGTLTDGGITSRIGSLG